MRSREAALLRAQLAEARAEGDPGEVASLCGLLARLEPEDPALPSLRAGNSALELARDADLALDRLLAVEEGEDSSLSWDALCALDELCAAAAFLGRTGEVAIAVGEASRAVRAFPEIWVLHADAAAELLRDRPPRPGDPALGLWAAVEASRWSEGVQPHVKDEGASPEVRIAAGADVVISLVRFSGQERLAAADELPLDPPWTGLARGEGWELALTVDEAGAPALLLCGAEGRFLRDGEDVGAVRNPDGCRCAVAPGAWSVLVAGRAVSFRLEG